MLNANTLFYTRRFCGPGTKLKERLARGEHGINNLDEACRTHDIAYDNSNSLSDRHRADEILENQAWEVFKSKNSDFGEKAAAWGVTTAMKAKRNIGGGCGFKACVSAARNVLKKKKKKINIGGHNLIKLAKNCVAVAKKKVGKNKKSKTPRIIHVPKKGGLLPLIPIFAGLSALGALTGGAASVIKVAREISAGKSTPTHLGQGLYLSPYKGGSYKLSKGDGLYLTPYKGRGGGGLVKKTKKN